MKVVNELKTLERLFKIYIKRKPHLMNLKNALDKLYGDNYDLRFGDYSRDNLRSSRTYKNFLHNYEHQIKAILYYPEITITNGELSHRITDLYVILNIWNIGSSGWFGIDGTRSLRTPKEIFKGYVHSHLPTNSYISTYEFCLGRTELSKFGNTEETSDIKKAFATQEDVEFLLYQIDSFIKWESLEGVPYITIGNLGTSSTLVRNFNPTIVQRLVKDIRFSNIKAKISNKSIDIIPTEDIENTLFQYIMTNPQYEFERKRYLCYKSIDGDYIDLRGVDPDINDQLVGQKVITFKGEDIKFKINNELNQDNYEYNAPNKYLTEAVCKELSKVITKEAIKRGSIRKENKVESVTQSSESDSLFM